MEKKRPGYLFRELQQPVPEQEKGAFEPFDRFNRWTKHKSGDLAIGAGAATVIFPAALPVAAGAALWHIGDSIQEKISQGVHKQFEKAKGKKMAKEQVIYSAA